MNKPSPPSHHITPISSRTESTVHSPRTSPSIPSLSTNNQVPTHKLRSPPTLPNPDKRQKDARHPIPENPTKSEEKSNRPAGCAHGHPNPGKRAKDDPQVSPHGSSYQPVDVNHRVWRAVDEEGSAGLVAGVGLCGSCNLKPRNFLVLLSQNIFFLSFYTGAGGYQYL